MRWLIVQSSPGFSVTAPFSTFPASTHTMPDHSPGPMSAIPAAPDSHGFQTTTFEAPDELSTSRRP